MHAALVGISPASTPTLIDQGCLLLVNRLFPRVEVGGTDFVHYHNQVAARMAVFAQQAVRNRVEFSLGVDAGQDGCEVTLLGVRAWTPKEAV